MAWLPDKIGVSNMRSIHARVTQNEVHLFCTPGYPLRERNNPNDVRHLFIEFFVELAKKYSYNRTTI
jgi:hypothetical protein